MNWKPIAGILIALILSALPLEVYGATKTLPRGEYGFLLNASRAEVDANVKNQGFTITSTMVDSAAPDGAREIATSSSLPINQISLVFEQEKADQIELRYAPTSSSATFEAALISHRRRFGKEVGVSEFRSKAPESEFTQSAYWSDGKTIAELTGHTWSGSFGLTLTYYNLPKGGRVTFGRFGSGKSISFIGR